MRFPLSPLDSREFREVLNSELSAIIIYTGRLPQAGDAIVLLELDS